jgi:hypothetical protein
MRIISGTVSEVDAENYEIRVETELDDYPIAVSVLTESPLDPIAGGAVTLPYNGANCLLLEHKQRYFMLGYYNLPTGGSSSGLLQDPEAPRVPLVQGDRIERHRAGNFVALGRQQWLNYAGLGSYMRLVGDPFNKFGLLAHNIEIENTAGYLKWKLEPAGAGDDAPSTFDLYVQRNFAQEVEFLPSDYVNLRAGSINSDQAQNFEDHIFELETIQFEGGNDPIIVTNLTLSKDEDNKYFNLNVANLLDNTATNLYISKGYNVNLEMTDGTRAGTISILNDDNLIHTNLNDKYDLTISNEGKINIDITDGSKSVTAEVLGSNLLDLNLDTKSTLQVKNSGEVQFYAANKVIVTSDNKISLIPGSTVNLGAETGAEPILLGNTLIQLLQQFQNWASTHIHPTGTGPSGPPTAPVQPTNWTSAKSTISKSS